jgi:hypothetical protein
MLEKPDGTRTLTKLGGLERPIPNPNNVLWILLKGFEDPSVVPPGTKVWLGSTGGNGAAGIEGLLS